MKAILVYQESGEPRLVWETVADIGKPGPDEVLVDVRATAVNRADLWQARGGYPPPAGASDILGLEMAGIVREVGAAAVDDWQPGDRVCALLPGGGYAEQVIVPVGMLLRLPDEWSFEQGAAVPEVWYTAFLNLFIEAGLQPGESVLVHAGASGVGTAAIQLLAAAGHPCYVTAGSDEKAASCRTLGTSLAVNYRVQDFAAAIMEANGGAGVDVILDPVGGAYLARNIGLLRRFGRLINIGQLGGRTGELDMGMVMGKRLHIIGSTLRSRSVEEKIALTRRFEAEVWPKLVSGELRPIIDRVYPIAEAQAAHEYVASNQSFGKVILTVP